MLAMLPRLEDQPENFDIKLPFRGLKISTESEVKLNFILNQNCGFEPEFYFRIKNEKKERSFH